MKKLEKKEGTDLQEIIEKEGTYFLDVHFFYWQYQETATMTPNDEGDVYSET